MSEDESYLRSGKPKNKRGRPPGRLSNREPLKPYEPAPERVMDPSEKLQLAELFYKNFTIFTSPRYQEDDYICPEANLKKWLLEEWAITLSTLEVTWTPQLVWKTLKSMLMEVEEYRLLQTDVTSCVKLVYNASFSLLNHVGDLAHLHHYNVEKWLHEYEQQVATDYLEKRDEELLKGAKCELSSEMRRKISRAYWRNTEAYDQLPVREEDNRKRKALLETWAKKFVDPKKEISPLSNKKSIRLWLWRIAGTDDISDEVEETPNPAVSMRKRRKNDTVDSDSFLYQKPLGLFLFSGSIRQQIASFNPDKSFDECTQLIYAEWQKKSAQEKKRTDKFRDMIGPTLFVPKTLKVIPVPATLEVTLVRIDIYQKSLLKRIPQFRIPMPRAYYGRQQWVEPERRFQASSIRRGGDWSHLPLDEILKGKERAKNIVEEISAFIANYYDDGDEIKDEDEVEEEEVQGEPEEVEQPTEEPRSEPQVKAEPSDEVEEVQDFAVKEEPVEETVAEPNEQPGPSDPQSNAISKFYNKEGYNVKGLIENEITMMGLYPSGPSHAIFDVVSMNGEVGRMVFTRQVDRRGDAIYYLWTKTLEIHSSSPVTMYVCVTCEEMANLESQKPGRHHKSANLLANNLCQLFLPSLTIDEQTLQPAAVTWYTQEPRHRCVPFFSMLLVEKFTRNVLKAYKVHAPVP
ncbi:unnamed protein product [Caenorhabditis auriculariae]|uniref:HMG box domain-containing protein n=1 Tax=Caenorhabditis auriculariae TaxID=2777116 RepID=A0A8S1GPQ5_9PELO|nr:unnamed protein product [Caenorhabditis auriculariae]